MVFSHLVVLNKNKLRIESLDNVSPSRAPVLSFTHYFQAPARQAKSLDWFNSDGHGAEQRRQFI